MGSRQAHATCCNDRRARNLLLSPKASFPQAQQGRGRLGAGHRSSRMADSPELVCQHGVRRENSGPARQLHDFLYGFQEDHGGEPEALHHGGAEEEGRC